MRYAALCSVLLAPAIAAQTFVVDAAAGPGASFTSIAAAVSTVPDGSTLIVRPGAYAGFEIVGKGLTILGGPGVVLTSPIPFPWYLIYVRNTVAAQPVVIRGVELAPTAGYGCALQGCAGAVVIEDFVDSRSILGFFPRAYSWDVSGCAQVLLRGCTTLHCQATASDVVLEGCALRGDSGLCGFGTCMSAFPALAVNGGTVQLVDSTLTGGNGRTQYVQFPALPNQPAVAATNGALRVLAPATLQSGDHAFLPPAEVVQGSGTLRLDPAVALVTQASPAIAATIVSQVSAMPAVRGHSASPGGALVADALGPVGSVVVLVVGLPGIPVAVAGIAEPFWLDPTAYAFFAFGVPQPGAPLTASVPVPNNPGLLGVRLGWQSVTAAGGSLQASNPSLTLVR